MEKILEPGSLNVLICHNEYGRPSGEEDALRSIAGLLTAHGHQVSWFLRSSTEIKSAAGKVKAFFTGIYNPQSRTRMAAMLDKGSFDLVHLQNLYPFLSPSVLSACQAKGMPVVMRCPNYRLFCPNSLHLSHGQVCERCLGGKEYWCVLRNCEGDYLKSLGYALRNAIARISRRILDNVSLFVVLSEFQKRRFIAEGIPADRIEILPNVTPEEADASGQAGVGELVTFVGRVSPEKGIQDFIEAARRLPNLPFAVAGATERMPELVARSPGNVRWLGFLNREDLNSVYLQSRMLVFPFRWFEGFPNVITRAMVLSRPVVASRIGAVPEIVDEDETGLLFETANVEELAARIRELYSDPERCREFGASGRRKALLQYGPEVVYTRLMQIYEKALGHAV